jgi:hypothetical protein
MIAVMTPVTSCRRRHSQRQQSKYSDGFHGSSFLCGLVAVDDADLRLIYLSLLRCPLDDQGRGLRQEKSSLTRMRVRGVAFTAAPHRGKNAN